MRVLYLRYSLSYRDLEESMLEHGLHVDHTTIYRWVQHSAPELEKRCRPHLKTTTDLWRVDETSIKIKGVWTYLYRAVDSAGNTRDFWLSATRDTETATQFFLKTLVAYHTVTPRVINVDKHAAYPKAFNKLKGKGRLPASCELRRVKYLNNLIEQDHRCIKHPTHIPQFAFAFLAKSLGEQMNKGSIGRNIEDCSTILPIPCWPKGLEKGFLKRGIIERMKPRPGSFTNPCSEIDRWKANLFSGRKSYYSSTGRPIARRKAGFGN